MPPDSFPTVVAVSEFPKSTQSDCRPELIQRAKLLALQQRDQFIGEEHLLLALFDSADGWTWSLPVERDQLVAAINHSRTAGGGDGTEADLPWEPRLRSSWRMPKSSPQAARASVSNPNMSWPRSFRTPDSFAVDLLKQVGVDADVAGIRFPKLARALANVPAPPAIAVALPAAIDDCGTLPHSAQTRACIADAEGCARRWQHEYMGTEHLLLALIEGTSEVPGVLAGLQCEAEAVKRRVLQEMRPGPVELALAPLPVTPRVERVYRFAAAEARNLGAVEIEPIHLILGMLLEREGAGSHALIQAGATAEGLRALLKGQP